MEQPTDGYNIGHNDLWDTGHQAMKFSGPLETGRNVSPVIAPAYCQERVSSSQCREGESRQSMIPWVGRDAFESVETEAARVNRTKYWRGENCTQKEDQGAADGSALAFIW